MSYGFKAHLAAAALAFMAGPALACQPIVFSDVDGAFHEVQVSARNCAEVSNFIRGYASRAEVTAYHLSRVVTAQFGAGNVRVVAFGDARVGVVQRNGGEADVDTYDGEISARTNGGRVNIRNRGPNTVIVDAKR